MKIAGLALVLCALFAPTSVSSQTAGQAPTVAFSRIESQLGTDSKVHVHWLYKANFEIRDGQEEVTKLDRRRLLQPAVFDGLRDAGIPILGDPSNLFEHQTQADLEIGGLIKALDGDINLPALNTVGATKLEEYPVNGEVHVTIDWQLYSAVDRRVVAQVTTRGTGRDEERRTDNLSRLIALAVTDSARAFVNSEAFKAQIAQRSAGGQTAASGDAASGDAAIALSGPSSRSSLPIADASGSVVEVLTGDGHGSGALIGAEGFVVTNAHVVGDTTRVTIRWSDGLETQGEVVRKQARRDVALIKTSPRGRVPLRLVQQPPAVGDQVYAVGAPLDESLQGTTTQGIVSANRIVNGFSFIQSDVAVAPGNSGGPLLNKDGGMIGITESGIQMNGVPVGLNMFIPAADIVAFLNLQVG